MPVPTLDFETYSEAGFVWTEPTEKHPLGRWMPPPGCDKPGLPAVGSAVYSEHPSTEVLTVSYDLCDGRGVRRWRPDWPLPADLFEHVAAGRPLESHNAMFERLIWTNVCCRRYGWPPLPAIVQRCSMATAHVAQFPGALAMLCDVLGTDDGKDKRGKDLIARLCVPQQPIPGLVDKKTGKVKRADVPARRIYPHDDPEGFEELCAYCDQDVRAEMAAADMMPPMEPHELVAWQMTQEQNWRGLAVDRDGLRACIDILGQVLGHYGQECVALTGFSVTQLQKLIGWIGAHGVHTTSLDAETTAMLLDRPLPDPVRRVLELRQATGSASVKKTYAMENQCSADNRLRNLVVHHGTRPGRPTGEGPQPLNLPKAGPKLVWCDACRKPLKDQPVCPWCGEMGAPGRRASWQPAMVDPVLEIMSLGSFDMVERFFGDAMTAIQGCVRGLFVAGEGCELVSTDYSSLQAVVAACLAGEQWRIDAFRRGDPIYLLGASKITGTPVETYLAYNDQHGEHHPDRQKIGKVSELACLSPETQVLTNRGYVAIVDVLTTDKLWDGVEWVTHRGLIDRGERTVVSLDGTRMTPDHLVSVNGSWTAAGQLVSNDNTRFLALETGSANLPWLARTQIPSLSNALAEPRHIWSSSVTFNAASRPAATPARRRKPARTARCPTAMLISYRTANIVGVCSIASRPVLPAAGPMGIQTTVRAVFAFSNRGHSGRQGGGSSLHISSRSLAGISPFTNLIAFERMVTMNRVISGSSQSAKTKRRDVRFETCKHSLTSTSRVYDIAHAGPRNRFTIKTANGHLIVHNCGFQGWINSYRAFGSEEPDDVIRKQILAWRAASPMIVEAWGGQWRGPPWRRERQELFGYEGCFVAAVRNPGSAHTYRGVTFCMEDGHDCLVIRLPQIDGTRRPLRYHQPRLHTSNRNADEVSITYQTYNSNPKYGPTGWVPMGTWGGRLFENVVMGVEVDIQRFGQKLLARHGYPLVLSVYDEDLCEIPVGKPLTLGLPPVDGLDPYVQEIEHLLGIMPPELADWPIRASGGWRGRRYRKG